MFILAYVFPRWAPTPNEKTQSTSPRLFSYDICKYSEDVNKTVAQEITLSIIWVDSTNIMLCMNIRYSAVLWQTSFSRYILIVYIVIISYIAYPFNGYIWFPYFFGEYVDFFMLPVSFLENIIPSGLLWEIYRKYKKYNSYHGYIKSILIQ